VQKSEYAIGITGHRRLLPDSTSELMAEVRRVYREKAGQCDAANIAVLSSAAEGADTLCAHLALDEGYRLIVPLPMSAMEYRKDFSEAAAAEFDKLLSLADEVLVVSADEPIPKNHSRGFWYRQAGLYVVKHCNVLLAIWNGVEKDTPDGAGTWETVKVARKCGKEVCYITV